MAVVQHLFARLLAAGISARRANRQRRRRRAWREALRVSGGDKPAAPFIFFGDPMEQRVRLENGEGHRRRVFQCEGDLRNELVLPIDDAGVEPAGGDVVDLKGGGKIDGRAATEVETREQQKKGSTTARRAHARYSSSQS